MDESENFPVSKKIFSDLKKKRELNKRKLDLQCGGNRLQKILVFFWLDIFFSDKHVEEVKMQWQVSHVKTCAFNMVYQVAPDSSLQDKILLLKIHKKTLPEVDPISLI